MLIHQTDTPGQAILKVKNYLKKSATGKKHKIRFFSISSIDLETNTVSSRMVVLRKFYSDWTVRFYTDHRTNKVSDIKQNPIIALLFWSPGENLQIRMKAKAVIHHQNEVCKKEWRNVTGKSQNQYSAEPSPGTILSSPDELTYRPDKVGSKYFTVVDCKPFDLQALQLQDTKNLALKFHRENKKSEWQGGWIVP